MRTKRYPILLIAWGLLAGCNENVEPKLPPETQGGKNTIGFKLNGKIWTPKGSVGTDNFTLVFGIYGIDDMEFGITAYRIEDNKRQYFDIGSDSLYSVGTYYLDRCINRRTRNCASFFDERTRCDYLTENTYCKGSLTITKLDLIKGIIAGRFELVIAEAGCDTLHITEGRFDKKLN